jgi:hypothetical protein
MQSGRSSPTFQRDVYPPSSGSMSKPSKKQATRENSVRLKFSMNCTGAHVQP